MGCKVKGKHRKEFEKEEADSGEQWKVRVAVTATIGSLRTDVLCKAGTRLKGHEGVLKKSRLPRNVAERVDPALPGTRLAGLRGKKGLWEDPDFSSTFKVEKESGRGCDTEKEVWAKARHRNFSSFDSESVHGLPGSQSSIEYTKLLLQTSFHAKFRMYHAKLAD